MGTQGQLSQDSAENVRESGLNPESLRESLNFEQTNNIPTLKETFFFMVNVL